MLSNIQNDEDRTRLEIVLTNGLALVKYNQGKNLEALMLERPAETLAAKYASMQKWAGPILNINIAKLMDKRSHNVEAAITQLKKNLISGESIIENARTNLAKFFLIEKIIFRFREDKKPEEECILEEEKSTDG